MRRTVLVAMLVTIGGLSLGAAALQQQQQKLGPVRGIQKLRDNLYFISGGDLADRATWTGGNVMALVTNTGVVLVDTMLPGAGKGILDQVKSVTDKPVTMIINTHTHNDHVGAMSSSRRRWISLRMRTQKCSWRRWTISKATKRNFFRRGLSKTR